MTRSDGGRSAEPWALGQGQVPRGGVMSHRSWEPCPNLGVAGYASLRAVLRALPVYKVKDVDEVEGWSGS